MFFLAAAALSGDLAPNPSLVLTSLLSGGAAIIIITLNFYIPILFSFVFLGERASFLQLTGIAPATVVIIFINLKSNDGRARNKKDNKSGIISACVACLANGTVNFGIKLRQYHTPGEGQNTFFGLTYLIAAVISMVLFLCLREKNMPHAEPKKLPVRVSPYPCAIIPGVFCPACPA